MGVKLTLRSILGQFLSAAGFNSNNADIEAAFDKCLDRTDTVDNAMEADLDMGLHNIINLAAGFEPHHAVNFVQLTKIIHEIIGKDKYIIRLRDPRQTATQGQRIFYTSAISPVANNNSVSCYINGVSQVEGIDFLTYDDRIEFTEGLDAGDFVDMYINESQSNTIAQMDRTNRVWENSVGVDTFNMKYSVGNLEVFLNGVKLKNQDDFIATNGTSIELTTPLLSNSDFLEAVSESNFTIANHYEKQDVYRKDETYSQLETYAKPEVYNRAETDAAIQASDGAVFVGAIVGSPSGRDKPGFLRCEGAAVNRIQYAKLYSEIGTMYGVGNGINTFNLPDYRGEFLRGFDNGRGVDAGRTLASLQGDMAVPTPHSHRLLLDTRVTGDDAAGFGPVLTADRNIVPAGGAEQPGSRIDTAVTNPTSAHETRPRNVSIMWLIKY